MCQLHPSFPVLHQIGNVVNKGLPREEQTEKKIQQKKLPPVGIEPETFFVDPILLFPT